MRFALSAFSRQVAFRYHASFFYRWRYASGVPERLLIAPIDLRTADPTTALDIYAGRFFFSGEGVDADGSLAAEAMDRTVAVLREYRHTMDDLGVPAGRVRMAATSAARDAANREVFFDAAEAAVGVRPELLSGEQEAELSFVGATAELDPAQGPFLVFDLGGGSTEFVYGTTGPDGAVEGQISLDVGCVRLTERFLSGDPPAPEDLTAAISYTDT